MTRESAICLRSCAETKRCNRLNRRDQLRSSANRSSFIETSALFKNIRRFLRFSFHLYDTILSAEMLSLS